MALGIIYCVMLFKLINFLSEVYECFASRCVPSVCGDHVRSSSLPELKLQILVNSYLGVKKWTLILYKLRKFS